MELPFNFEKWTVEHVCHYLQQKGLGKWADKFKEHTISGDKLRDLTDEYLKKEMKIGEPDDRKKILDFIRGFWMITGKVFNDPIHGQVELHPLLIKIIDTPQFQRLRYIKQLGGVYSVYPGASHNRFEHSIGVGHLAGQLAEALRTRQPELNITDRDILCVQIAGLCHDLGHGPFSHLYDGIFIPEARPGYEWKHETASLKMFDHLVEENGLKQVMEQYGLVPNEDLVFIKEMIGRPENTDADPDEWPYEGRTEDKSFLYKIVANKANGIDVDKFDYLARDCHHLGIQNNFDFRRFIMFARVCEVDGKKHICSRDKEVANLYDMFYTRNCLHRRACQHKVNHIIQIMIAEAFLKADEHIKIEGSGGKMFTLSTAIDDMEAYTKLTDQVFEQILNSSSDELNEAREILHKIVSRKLYRFLGEVKIEKKEMISGLKEELNQKYPQWAVSDVTFNYGMKEKNPIDKVYFYSKHDHTKAFKIPKDQVSKLLPQCFSEHLIRVYSRETGEESLTAAKNNFVEWCEEKGFPTAQDGNRVTPE